MKRGANPRFVFPSVCGFLLTNGVSDNSKGEHFQEEGGVKMLDMSVVSSIERHGCVGNHGQRIYGTAALLRFLHTPVGELDTRLIETGKEYVQKLLSA